MRAHPVIDSAASTREVRGQAAAAAQVHGRAVDFTMVNNGMLDAIHELPHPKYGSAKVYRIEFGTQSVRDL